MSVVMWFTGLSGSGKTTIASALKIVLEALGKKVEIIDGDTVRNTLHRHLGFSREDIRENNRLIAGLAFKKLNQEDFVLVPIISPYREDRAVAREVIGKSFIELFVNCPLDLCQKRDTKGLYAKAAAGELDNLIGVSPTTLYELPLKPDIEIRTDQTSLENSVGLVVQFLINTARL